WRLQGRFDLSAFREALNEVQRRHETLRTTFSSVEGRPVEVISSSQALPLTFEDLSTRTDPDSHARQRIHESARLPFDLQQGPLFRVHVFRLSELEHIVLFNLHHIIADAWSFEILRREITALYTPGEPSKPAAELPALPIQYLDYAHWQRNEIARTAPEEIAFWKDYLSGELPDSELPTDAPAAPGSALDGASEPITFSPEITIALKQLARQESATPFIVLLAAFKALLHRLTGQNDFIVGTPISGRDQIETESLIGLFVNTIAVRTRIENNPTFIQLLASVRESSFQAFAHHQMPFDEVVKALQPERSLGKNPLFQVIMALHGGYPAQWTLGDLRASILEVETSTAKFDWTFLLEQTDDGIKGRLEYRTDRFEPAAIQRFLQQFRLVVDSIVADPARPISELPLLSDAERQLVLLDWNQTTTAYERNHGIHELFESQAAKTPGAIALISQQRRITYGELNRRANQLARRLKQLGIRSETLVGVALDRSPEMIISLLAILKAGGAYLPLDSSHPRERLEFLLQDTAAPLVITDSRSGWEANASVKTICLDQERDLERESGDNLERDSSAANLAYVMFTSGSTGLAKGAAIPHRAVIRLVRHTNYITFSASDVFLHVAPLAFDASTFEIWGALLNGARLVLFPPEIPSLEELGRTIETHQITTLWLTAGLFHQMVDEQLPSLKSVRQLLAGGDVLSVPHVLKVIRELPNCRLINGYGPTENTTFTCCYPVPADWRGGKSVPIGKPISNTRVYVLDQYLSPVPVGVPGELFIGGDGLAREYVNRPELNREKFITRPEDDERLYRTGDRVRWRPDGNLEFLGRNDRQAKIRGFRVEPGEIESVLMQHPSVREAAVVAREIPAQGTQLVAHVAMQPGCSFDAASLQQFLRSKLPVYMIPSCLMEARTLPLTANGKLDYRALPSPDFTSNTALEASQPPRNSTEELLLKIWSEVLGRDVQSIHDNFFQLGGHSLLATRIISHLAKSFQVELPVRAIFEAPTVAELADRIRHAPPAELRARAIVNRRNQRAEARQLLARIDELSEAEVESLLARPN
ncbi:MAG: non-ribosomal peptide synthetase, partial [Verrucomicrobiota bacterium]